MPHLQSPTSRKASAGKVIVREACFGACLAGLLCLPILAGCGGSSNGNASTPSTTTTTGTTTGGSGGTTDGDSYNGLTASASGTTATGLTAGFATSSSPISVGGTVTFLVVLENYTNAAIPIRATSLPAATPAAQLVVTGPNGAVSFKSPVVSATYNGTLAPGQQIVSYITVSGFTAPGAYSVTATFSDDTTAQKSVGPVTLTAQ